MPIHGDRLEPSAVHHAVLRPPPSQDPGPADAPPEIDWHALAVRRVIGFEAIGQPWELTIEVVARGGREAQPAPDPDAWLGTLVDLVLSDAAHHELRTFHGLLASARVAADDNAILHPVYTLRLVPRFFRASLVTTQDVFVDQSIIDLVRQKLARHALGHAAAYRLIESYPKRELVVQYKESDLAFVNRLCEHAGVSYFFESHAGEERVVFTDHETGFPMLEVHGAPPQSGLTSVAYAGRGEKRGIHEIATESRLVPAAYAVSDYNYRIPDVDLGAVRSVPGAHGGGVVEYGSHHATPEEGEALARVRAEEQSARRREHTGSSSQCELAAGRRFVLDDHARLGDTPLLITRVEHDLTIGVGAEDSATTPRYENRFTAVNAAPTYRTPRITPRPRIHGVVTGIVQPGPNGEVGTTAKLDADGRYIVQMHFDTSDRSGQKASQPVRMAQPYAGPGHGMHFPLRPGAEVLLAFVDGDPDRPIIVGALPNAVNRSPSDARSANRNRMAFGAGVLIEVAEGK